MGTGFFDRIKAGKKGEEDPLQTENTRLTAEIAALITANAALTSQAAEHTATGEAWAAEEQKYVSRIRDLETQVTTANARAAEAESKAAADIAAKEADVAARANRQAADQIAATGLDAGATPKTNAENPGKPNPAARTGPLSERDALKLIGAHFRGN
ncbi:MAG: hypothetical protein EOP87_00245 [Verrucomicrobiaceae bacterium]|nr:MAG: hypothetical protein EOP87_00245 [Verrucomicrobiaceae bacterium]